MSFVLLQPESVEFDSISIYSSEEDSNFLLNVADGVDSDFGVQHQARRRPITVKGYGHTLYCTVLDCSSTAAGIDNRDTAGAGHRRDECTARRAMLSAWRRSRQTPRR